MKAGDTLISYPYYYICNDIARNDLMFYKHPNKKILIVKSIYGIPGDIFEYKNKNIFINGKKAKNFEGVEFSIESKMLELYAKSYQIIPENSYFILGGEVNGGFDSSKFGFVSLNDIDGKVKLKR